MVNIFPNQIRDHVVNYETCKLGEVLVVRLTVISNYRRLCLVGRTLNKLVLINKLFLSWTCFIAHIQELVRAGEGGLANLVHSEFVQCGTDLFNAKLHPSQHTYPLPSHLPSPMPQPTQQWIPNPPPPHAPVPHPQNTSLVPLGQDAAVKDKNSRKAGWWWLGNSVH